MPPLPILAGNTLDPGTRIEAMNTYAQMYRGLTDRLGGVMQFAVPSTHLTEIYSYFETPPYAQRWPRGTNRPNKGFKSVKFTVTNHDWTVGTRWHLNDEQDAQIPLVSHARIVATRAANLAERVFFQILQGTTDPDLLPAVPTAPDGSALFSSSTRFGRASGNLLTGTGVSTGSLILADFYSVRAAYRGYQDTEGQPLLDDAAVDEGVYHIFYNSDNDLVFRQAFVQSRSLVIVKNVAATENVAATTPTNIILESGVRVMLHPTQRITDNKWYVILEHGSIPIKPIVQQARYPMTERVQTMENSDEARSTKFVGFDFDWREGYYVNLPYMAVEVSN